MARQRSVRSVPFRVIVAASSLVVVALSGCGGSSSSDSSATTKSTTSTTRDGTTTTEAKGETLPENGPIETGTRYTGSLASKGTFDVSFIPATATEVQWVGPVSLGTLMPAVGGTHQGLSVWELSATFRGQGDGDVNEVLEPAQPGYLDWLTTLPGVKVESDDAHATVGGVPARAVVVSYPGDGTEKPGPVYLADDKLCCTETLEIGDKAYVAVVDDTALVIITWSAAVADAQSIVDQTLESLVLTIEP